MTDQLTQAVIDRKGRRETGGEIRFICPVHDESEPSCYFNPDKGLWYCHGCDAKGNARQLANLLGVELPEDRTATDHGLPPGIPPTWAKGKFHHKTVYPYRDESGGIRGYVVRYESPGDKVHIPFFRLDDGRWRSGSPRAPRRLYRLEQLSKRPSERVWVVEGEKCVDALQGLGVLAVTSIAGSKSAKKAQWKPLAGRQVTIWPDNDEPGAVYAATVRGALLALSPPAIVSTVDVSTLGLTGRGDDVVDWLAADDARGAADLDGIAVQVAEQPTEQHVDEHPHTEVAGCEAGCEPGWEDSLLLTSKGSTKINLANLILIIRNHPQWRDVLAYNTRSLREMVRKPPPWAAAAGYRPKQLIDQHARLATEWFAQRWQIGVSSSMAHEALATIARENPFDPVRDYFDGLEWDGVERLDFWLPSFCGVRADNYHRAIGAKFLISGVARTFQPGAKVDTMLILEGPQGALKSTLLRELAGHEFFSDQIHDISNKDGLMQLHGPLLIEMADLDATSKKEATAVKAFLSTFADSFRPPYGRSVETFPRMCVFAGTTNHEIYLKDDTGGRRFWPVAVEKCDLEGIRAARDQLWAEAVHRYKGGECWYLEGDVEQTAAKKQETRRQGDPWESLIAKYLETPGKKVNHAGEAGVFDQEDGKRLCISVEEVLAEAVQVPKAQQMKHHEMRAGSVLRAFGWRRKRKFMKHENRQIWVYVPPPEYHEGETLEEEQEPTQGRFPDY